MKRLLILTALALMTASSVGCGSCGGGSCGGGFGGLGLGLFGRRGCNSCERCESCSPCGDDEAVIESPTRCNCNHSGASMPSLGTPSVTPDTYSFIPRK